MAETRQFKMHPQLLFDVISRQAGTLTKALTEGVMNSIDAGARSVAIELGPKAVSIRDDGRGFSSREEIESFFETFGEPHREGDATYGTFRMGRGQIFSFGRNTWVSGPFKMDVDIKGRGLDYELSVADNPGQPGCHIQIALYEELSLYGLRSIADDLRRAVRYTEIPVLLDGVLINKDPAKEKWDRVTDLAYYRFSTGRLSIYNLGVFVNDNRNLGVGGVVVARRQLRLNFARNDVLVDECRVWKAIAPVIRAQADQNIERKRGSLNMEERTLLAARLRSSDLPRHEALSAPLLQDTTGRWRSIQSVALNSGKYSGKIAVGPRNSIRADKAMQAGAAFVLNEETLDTIFRVDTLEHLVESVILPTLKGGVTWQYKIATLDDLPVGDGKYDLIPPSEYTSSESLVIELAGRLWSPHGERGQWEAPRRIVLGSEEGSDGWTDGETYIAISRAFIAKMNIGQAGSWADLAALVLHEYCHGGPSTDTHSHSPEFFEAYHDLSTMWLGKAVNMLMRELTDRAARVGKQALKVLDKTIAATRAADQMPRHLPMSPPKRPAKPSVSASPAATAGARPGSSFFR